MFFFCGTVIDQTKESNEKMFRVTENQKRYETSLSFGHLKSHYLSGGVLVGCRLADTPVESGGAVMDDAVVLIHHLPLVLSQEC